MRRLFAATTAIAALAVVVLVLCALAGLSDPSPQPAPSFASAPAASRGRNTDATSTPAPRPEATSGASAPAPVAMGVPAATPGHTGDASPERPATAGSQARLLPTAGRLGMLRVVETRGNDGRRRVTRMLADRVLVQVADAAQLPALRRRCDELGHRVLRYQAPARLAVVGLASGDLDAVPRARARLATLPGVVRVASERVLRLTDTVPDDPRWSELWGMARIGAPAAWDLATGSRQVLVGVIDTGIDRGHRDLAGNIHVNHGEVPGNGADDDGNGYIDDVNGWDFVNGDSDPADDHYHGTHVAGTIGARGDNATGVAGVSWRVRLMPLKVFDNDGQGLLSDAVAALDYATENGCALTNNSWGAAIPLDDPDAVLLHEAAERAATAGTLLVAAAGNNADDTDVTPFVPAGLATANILSVAAIDADDQLASFSNFGVTSVDLAAPGVGVLSCVPGPDPALQSDHYRTANGTSMASPHVAGAAALLLSVNPDLDIATLTSALLGSVETLPALADTTASGGLLDLAAALDQARQGRILVVDALAVDDPPALDGDNNDDALLNAGEEVWLDVTLRNSGTVAITGARGLLKAGVTAPCTVVGSATQDFGTVAPGATATARFRVRVDAGTVHGTPAGLSLALAGDDSYAATRTLLLDVVQSGSIAGQVRLDGAPVAGVRVRVSGGLDDRSALTDSAGDYQIAVPIGRHLVAADHGAWFPAAPQELVLTAAASDATHIDFEFTTIHITGRVTRATDAAPVVGSTVRLKEVAASTTTDTDGNYALAYVVGSPTTFSLWCERRDGPGAHHPSGIHAIDTAQATHAVDLQVLPGGYAVTIIDHDDHPMCLPVAINASGQVAGMVGDQLTLHPDVPDTPFRYTDLDGDGEQDDGELLLLGHLPGTTTGRAAAMNDAGQVTGFCHGHDMPFHGFLFTDANGNNLVDAGEMVDLGNLGGNVIPEAINASGAVVGQAVNDEGVVQPFVWEDGTMRAVPGVRIGRASAINAQGEIVGRGQLDDGGDFTSFIHLPEPAYGLTAGTHELPGAWARCIDDDGLVALYVSQRGETETRRVEFWQAGTSTPMPGFPHYDRFSPWDLGADGRLVGDAHNLNGPRTQFLHNQTGCIDLRDALPPALPYDLYPDFIVAINAADEIAIAIDADLVISPGYGIGEGELKTGILRPIAAPAARAIALGAADSAGALDVEVILDGDQERAPDAIDGQGRHHFEGLDGSIDHDLELRTGPGGEG